jgi:hypothetical protein
MNFPGFDSTEEYPAYTNSDSRPPHLSLGPDIPSRYFVFSELSKSPQSPLQMFPLPGRRKLRAAMTHDAESEEYILQSTSGITMTTDVTITKDAKSIRNGR